MEIWITPALVVALAALMIGMIRSLRGDLEKRIDGVDRRIDEVRSDLGKRIDGVDKRIDETRSDLGGRIDRIELRMDRLETGLVAVKEGLAEVRGELGFVRDYILRRNAPAEEPPAAPAE